MKISSEIIEIPKSINFYEFKNFLRNRKSIYSEVFDDKSVKYFLNLSEIDDPSIDLKDGDDIAFLPPLTVV